ncbi:hypothetical protein LCGC14_0729120 [marine sediment metagenome]|uniref:Uncharacterized protein n=1 Tax=marine sediment metagenome TaxID=412755 RepID=A0A0F9QAA5_9ZZZZ
MTKTIHLLKETKRELTYFWKDKSDGGRMVLKHFAVCGTKEHANIDADFMTKWIWDEEFLKDEKWIRYLLKQSWDRWKKGKVVKIFDRKMCKKCLPKIKEKTGIDYS